MKRTLILEDGTVFEGTAMGSSKEEVICEIVFTTGMGGYIETLTDPSFVKQAVVMTYPLMGNYGVMEEDNESEHPWVSAFITREICEHENNFRSKGKLNDYLLKYDIPALVGIDTRALTKILREKGTMMGLITTEENIDVDKAVAKIKAAGVPHDHVSTVSRKEVEKFGKDGKYNVALLDYGTKKSIIESLVKRGCNVTVYPYNTPAEEIIKANPDGIMLSNGPGNPEDCPVAIEELKKISQTSIPIFGICLGHQLLALANGATTTKLKYGHRGENHSVKDLDENKIYVTSQNHGYMINAETLNPEVAVVSHINVNDKTVEGIRYIGKKAFSVQFHPEACPGPKDTEYLFDKFIENMKSGK